VVERRTDVCPDMFSMHDQRGLLIYLLEETQTRTSSQREEISVLKGLPRFSGSIPEARQILPMTLPEDSMCEFCAQVASLPFLLLLSGGEEKGDSLFGGYLVSKGAVLLRLQ
jgi:hypothetical protein